MFSEMIQKKRYERSPEDSGEWLAQPIQFKRLPPPEPTWGWRDTPEPAKQRLRTWANLLPLIQLALGAALFFLGACLPDTPDGIWWILTVPALVGLFSAMCVVLHAASDGRVPVGAALGATMRGQIWWGLLLLIPCYGWGVLAICVPPCAAGTLVGTSLALLLSRTGSKPVTP
ncbi:MAG: hypothetical protein KDB82_07590 [Planctomycetes bacterium]|nr:hypothetical protein [Planctomycetota bacterium]